jgi:hypothetical protein
MPTSPALSRNVTFERMMLQHANEGMDTFVIAYLHPELGLKPVAPKVKTDLPKMKIDVTEGDDEEVGRMSKGEVCPICQGEWEPGEEAVRLRCNHFMHEECMQQCLTYDNKCPVCRESISGDDDEHGDDSAHASASADGQGNTMGGHWRCVGCTLETTRDRARTCSACDVSRGAALLAEGLRDKLFRPVLAVATFHSILHGDPTITDAQKQSLAFRSMQGTLDREIHRLLSCDELTDLVRRGWELADAVEDIIIGERDGDALTEGIDPNSRAVVLDLLQQLGSKRGREMRSTLKLQPGVFDDEAAVAEAGGASSSSSSSSTASSSFVSEHFPHRAVVAKPAMPKSAYPKVMDKIKALNAGIGGCHDDGGAGGGAAGGAGGAAAATRVLSDEDIRDLGTLVRLLQTWGTSCVVGRDAKLWDAGVAALEKMLRLWPAEIVFAGLDLMRSVLANSSGKGHCKKGASFSVITNAVDHAVAAVQGSADADAGASLLTREAFGCIEKALSLLINVSYVKEQVILSAAGGAGESCFFVPLQLSLINSARSDRLPALLGAVDTLCNFNQSVKHTSKACNAVAQLASNLSGALYAAVSDANEAPDHPAPGLTAAERAAK